MTRDAAPVLASALAIVIGIGRPGAGLAQEPGASRGGTSALSGVVTGPSGEPLAGVLVTLVGAGEAGEATVQTTGPDGEFSFAEVRPGTYAVYAALGGYQDVSRTGVEVAAGESSRLALTLRLAPISESVLVRESVAEEERLEPEQVFEQVFTPEAFTALPLPTDRFQEALPLVPGVVRDPEGRLSFNGARPSQSQLLVNGANVTDPVTGEFAVELPLKAIEAVEVHSLPYSAEFGRVTGAVARIKTRGGSDVFDFETGDLWPKPNFRGGSIRGIRTFVPHVRVSGPIRRGRAWFSQGFAYRFARTRVFDVPDGPDGDDERVLENFDSFTQLDFRLADEHQLTTTFSFFPVEVENLGVSALRSAEAAPDFESGGWNFALSQRSFFASALVETLLAVKTFDVSLEPKSGSRAARITPEGPAGSHFNELTRDSRRVELGTTVTYAPPDLLGRHVVKLGGNLAVASFSGLDAGRTVWLEGAEARPVRRIDFLGDPEIAGRDRQSALFVQDAWRPTDRVGVDLGLRYDYDDLVEAHRLAPRLSAAVALDARGRNVVKAGWGVFYDHVNLHADRFESSQSRRETPLGPDGEPSGPSVVYRPRIAPEGLTMPRSATWNVEYGRLLSEGVQLRVNYRERRGERELIVDRVADGPSPSLLLSSRGSSLARELDVTLRLRRAQGELYLSYSRARSIEDLNGLDALRQNLRSPIFLDNERSLSAFDVPHRGLVWGVWELPAKLTFSPGLEWRSGFPYTVLDGSYAPVGARSRGGRFPNFLSVDFRLMKALTVKGRAFRIGVQVFNLGSHRNPRDVIANTASPRFGELLNSVDMGISFRFSLGS